MTIRPRFLRVLILGNSITLHPPKADIGWDGNWGMAASAEEKDYSHLLLKRLAEAAGAAPLGRIENIADFERQHGNYDMSRFRQLAEFGADLIVVAIGENVPTPKTPEAQEVFRKAMAEMLAVLTQNRVGWVERPVRHSLGEAGSDDPPSGTKGGEGGSSACGLDPAYPSTQDRHAKLIVRSSFWPSQIKDAILKKTCEEAGGTFVNISLLGGDPTLRASSERTIAHKGVGDHPGDKGMAAIAECIWNAILTQ